MQIPPSISCEVECKGGLDGIRKIAPEPDAFDRKAEVFKALSSTIRLRILSLLAIQSMCVCMIKHYMEIADSKLSYHLNRLREAGLIASEQHGNFIIYSATDMGKKMMAMVLDMSAPTPVNDGD